MSIDELRNLYRYNSWANDAFARVLRELPDETFRREVGGAFPSLQRIFAHLVAAEWVWLERWQGHSPAAFPEWVQSGNASLLADVLRDVESRRAGQFTGLRESDLETALSLRYLSGQPASHVLRDVLVHVVNHSTYHRGQLSLMMRLLDLAPPSTDFIRFPADLRS